MCVCTVHPIADGVWQLYKVANHIFLPIQKETDKIPNKSLPFFFGLEIWWIFLLTLFYSIALPSIFVRLVFLCVRHSSPFYLFINVIITTCLQFMFLYTGDKRATHKHTPTTTQSVNRQCEITRSGWRICIYIVHTVYWTAHSKRITLHWLTVVGSVSLFLILFLLVCCICSLDVSRWKSRFTWNQSLLK